MNNIPIIRGREDSPLASTTSAVTFDAHPAEMLLKNLWGEKNHHFLATRDPATGIFTTIPVSSNLHASKIVQQSTKSGLDVFFAPASFKSRGDRKADNAVGADSLWMDIDVDPDNANNKCCYLTKEAALDELYIFCAMTNIPRPTIIVCSGRGLHVYWVLNQFIGLKLWHMLATKLKELAKHLNFRDDPHRTADIASLMRVPGTLNHKYKQPLLVELISTTDTPIKLCVISDAITTSHNRLVSATPKQPRKDYGHCESADMKLLEAILLCLDPDMVYTDWFRVAAAMFNYSKASDEAYDLFDAWSSRGNKYKGHKDTLKLWRSLRLDHPNPITIGTLRMMVEEAGHDWVSVCAESSDFIPTTYMEG